MSALKPVGRIAVVGTGANGARWTAPFLATGLHVAASVGQQISQEIEGRQVTRPCRCSLTSVPCPDRRNDFACKASGFGHITGQRSSRVIPERSVDTGP
jgi:hypothetical protein